MEQKNSNWNSSGLYGACIIVFMKASEKAIDQALTGIFNHKLLSISLTQLDFQRTAEDFEHHFGTHLCQCRVISALA